jgi:hypothetical protein
MEATKQTGTAPPTPEQLMKLLEFQLNRERGQRERKARNRATFLVGGILFIIIAAGIALVVAEQLLADLRERGALQPLSGQMGDSR